MQNVLYKQIYKRKLHVILRLPVLTSLKYVLDIFLVYHIEKNLLTIIYG